ncbi:hypothetical protein SGGMMB4_02639 [Sodalis glossinidius str. 'morsitans']|uniref:Uncharacterized protein n=1 Tax=Sodalis glossinidius (strain morsitans) TaxID=343509 RepID=A0A193QJJ9_SODGM|nr:hypothetical protein [Sodalis glossinidius]CRL45105.1 hypothetical protein SGGMMB4_02639 [Sodalis glossinidius str. 'morsitans']
MRRWKITTSAYANKIPRRIWPDELPLLGRSRDHMGQERKAAQLVTFERDETICTKAEIGSRREATAMATASVAVRERNKLAARLGECFEHSTVLAVKNRTGIEYPWRPLRQWCVEHEVEAITVPNARYGAVRS